MSKWVYAVTMPDEYAVVELYETRAGAAAQAAIWDRDYDDEYSVVASDATDDCETVRFERRAGVVA